MITTACVGALGLILGALGMGIWSRVQANRMLGDLIARTAWIEESKDRRR